MTRGVEPVPNPRLNRRSKRAAHPVNAVRVRCLAALACLSLAFIGVGARLVELALRGQNQVRVSVSKPLATGFSRPDIVDRNGRLLASDIAMPSLFADPALILDRDEASEKLTSIFPDLDAATLRASFADRRRRFVWIKRGIAPALAQRVHDLGLPGLAFRRELRRAYPMGRLAGHVLGHVNIDNKGLVGIEKYLDKQSLVEPVHTARPSSGPPLRLSIDVATQHGLESELTAAMLRYRAKAAAGVILDINTGAVRASASLPAIDPANSDLSLNAALRDKITAGAYELGSVFKALTFAYGLESKIIDADSSFDIAHPLKVDDFTLTDHLKTHQPLSLTEAFVRSSNIAAGLIGLQAGSARQRDYLERFGLTQTLKTEAGTITPPRLPKRWGRTEAVTVSYGHGLAVAPLQFAAAVAGLINGGTRVKPAYLLQSDANADRQIERVVSRRTSNQLRALFRANVAGSSGTGKRARVTGYDVGGKTGTAEIAGPGGYRKDAVIASFVAVFPMRAPKYLTLVMLFEPQPKDGDLRSINASRNAAPTTARLITRVAPLLGVLPKKVNADVRLPAVAGPSPQAMFDGARHGQ